MTGFAGRATNEHAPWNRRGGNDDLDIRQLTRPQRAMLALLDDGPEEDSVGLEVEDLTSHQVGVCERLVGKDLVRFDIGWRHSCWFRLTEAGRDALGELHATNRTS